MSDEPYTLEAKDRWHVLHEETLLDLLCRCANGYITPEEALAILAVRRTEEQPA